MDNYNSENAKIYLNSAQSALGRRDYDLAASYAKKSMDAVPDNAQACITRILALLHLNSLEDAAVIASTKDVLCSLDGEYALNSVDSSVEIAVKAAFAALTRCTDADAKRAFMQQNEARIAALDRYNEYCGAVRDFSEKHNIDSLATGDMEKLLAMTEPYTDVPAVKALYDIYCAELEKSKQRDEEERREQIEKARDRKRANIKRILKGTALLALVFVIGYIILNATVIQPTRVMQPVLAAIADADIGDVVQYGTFSIDKEGDGKPIDWYVLAKEDGKALLVSRFCLDSYAYNYTDQDITWETSTLRSWLNDSFYRIAFTRNERKHIQDAENGNADNPAGTEGGNATADRVFLLSKEEAERYLPQNLRAAKMTPYAARNTGDYGYCFTAYWLRSVGGAQNCALAIKTDGSITGYGINVTDGMVGVRPAIRVELPKS